MTFPSEGFAHVEELQKWLALIEVMFAGTVGFLIGDLFPGPSRTGE
jgi:hypothetical protein